jgi:predicted permease
MISKIKKFIIVGSTSLMMLLPGLVPAVVGMAAADNTSTDNTSTIGGAGSNVAGGLCTGINAATTGTQNNANCGTTNGSGEDTLQSIAKKIVNIFSLIVGVAAVIMIIVGGFRYITSGGDSTRVGGAKNTLIYAIVGLIIVALAQAIVHFVLNNATTANSPGA